MTTAASRRRDQSLNQAMRKFRVILERLPAEDVERLSIDLDEALRAGTAPTSTPVRKQIVRQTVAAQADEFRVRQRLLAEALTAPEVAAHLNVSRQTPHDRVRAGTLLAIMDRGMLRFPAWQFDPTGPDGVLDGLPEVIRALGDMPTLSKIGWMVSPKALLPDAPVEMLRHGTPAARREVLRAAEAATRL
jgi:hypothetical protein